MSHTDTCKWNLEKWYRRTQFQGRNRDMEVENGHVDTAWGEEGGMNWEVKTDIRTLPSVKQIASGNLQYSPGSSAHGSTVTQPGGMRWAWKGGGGGKAVQEGSDIYTHTAHSLETNTAL